MEFAVIAHRLTETNHALATRGWQGVRSHLLTPREALLRLRSGDVALNRLDVSTDLDGVEEGIWGITQLEAQGVRVLNRPPSRASEAGDATSRFVATARRSTGTSRK
jgi:hypothetical protein